MGHFEDTLPPETGVSALGPLRILRTTSAALIDTIEERMWRREKTFLAFCNAHTAALALRDPGYAAVLHRSILVNDGVGIDLVLRMLRQPPCPENLNGTDFVPRLLAALLPRRSLFLLGSTGAVINEVRRRWRTRFPQHDIVGSRDGFFRSDQEMEIVAAINASGADILLVGMGNPLQEQFIATHIDALSCLLCVGVGALFDFESQEVPRAPSWVRRARLEWCYRLAREPRRLGYRYLIEPAELLWLLRQARRQGR